MDNRYYRLKDRVQRLGNHHRKYLLNIERNLETLIDRLESRAILDQVYLWKVSESPAEQMQFVVDDAPGLVEKVSSSISARAPDALRLAAHRLKGLVGNFDARDASECAASLEHMGQMGNLEEADPVCRKLEQLVSALVETLKRFLATH